MSSSVNQEALQLVLQQVQGNEFTARVGSTAVREAFRAVKESEQIIAESSAAEAINGAMESGKCQKVRIQEGMTLVHIAIIVFLTS